MSDRELNECYPCRGDGMIARPGGSQTCPYCRGLGESALSSWDGVSELNEEENDESEEA